MSRLLTVVVPTYNRPNDLARLLRFLRNSAPHWPIIVLDSSSGEAAAANLVHCCGIPDVLHERYEPSVYFYDKLADGVSRLVSTPAVCLCADDDLLVPDGIDEAVRVLAGDGSIAVAHGYTAQFTLVGGPRLTGLGAISPASMHDNPVNRIAEALLSYEATFYAVHRRELLVNILTQAAKAPSLLSAELLTCVLALAHGRLHRVHGFSHARNIAPSHSYTHWHPAEALSVDPYRLATGLCFVRDCLAAHLPTATPEQLRPFDLALLAYISSHLNANTTQKIARMAIEGRNEQELRDAGWSAYTAGLQPNRAMSALKGSVLARWLGSELVRYPKFRERVLRVARNGWRRAPQISIDLGRERVSVAIEAGFTRSLAKLSLGLSTPQVCGLTKTLAQYYSGLL